MPGPPDSCDHRAGAARCCRGPVAEVPAHTQPSRTASVRHISTAYRWCSVKTVEIPKLVSELFELSKLYLEQEAVAPLRRTARYAGYSLLGGLLLGMGWVLLAVAGFRLVLDLLPETMLWSALAYLIGAALALGMAVSIMWAAGRSKVSP